VPRLIGRKAPARALRPFRAPSDSWRISACPGPLYQSAWHLFGPADRHFTFSPDWTLAGSRCYIIEFALSAEGLEVVTRVLERAPPQLCRPMPPKIFRPARAVCCLVCNHMAGVLPLSALALAPGGYGIIT